MSLRFADRASLDDLGTFVARAKYLDATGAARLSGHGSVLAVYVCPLHGGGGPDVLGLRTVALAQEWRGDVVVDLAALTDRFARRNDDAELALPPAEAPAAWAGVSPPRRGWTPAGELDPELLRSAARDGVTAVAAGVPDVAGAPAVARLRAGVWSRPLPGTDVPAGAAFAADGLGFLGPEPVAVLATGPWHRLTTPRGHVLTRRPLLG